MLARVCVYIYVGGQAVITSAYGCMGINDSCFCIQPIGCRELLKAIKGVFKGLFVSKMTISYNTVIILQNLQPCVQNSVPCEFIASKISLLVL